MSHIIRNNNSDLMIELIKSKFGTLYSGSFLGFLWVILKPIFNFCVLYLIFNVFRGGPKDALFAPKLLIGTITYGYFRDGMANGMTALISSSKLLLKIYFERELVLISTHIIVMINLIVNLLIVLTLVIYKTGWLSIVQISYFFLILIVLSLLIYGINLFTSVIVCIVRDLKEFIDLGLRLLFWASAIFYDFGDIGGKIGILIRFNPIGIIIDALRSVLLYNKVEYTFDLIIIGLVSVVLIVFGKIFFNKYVHIAIEQL